MARSRRQKRPKPRPPSQALPAELVEHIVGFLEPDDRRCALARLVRVSRGFHASARWLLYERIEVQFANVEQPREEGNSCLEAFYSDRGGWESPFWTLTRGSAACLAMLSRTTRLAALVRRFEARGPHGSCRASAVLWPTDYNLLDRALAAVAPYIQHLTVRVALLCPEGKSPSSSSCVAYCHELQLPCKMPRLTDLDWRCAVSIGMRGQRRYSSGADPFPFPSLQSLALRDFDFTSSSTRLPTLALTYLALHHRVRDKHLSGLCQLVAPSLTSLVLDYYHFGPWDYWDEKAYGGDNLPFSPLRRLTSLTVVLRHQVTELNVIHGFASWPTAGTHSGATFQADFNHLCDLLGTLPRENPVVPKLRLPPLIPTHLRERDREFWTKVLKERKKPERPDQARRVDSSLA
ncbi:hypothetical protein BJY59DRAFT_701320 [Rhodotorula toruloides]